MKGGALRKQAPALFVAILWVAVLAPRAEALTYGPATNYPLNKEGPNSVVVADFDVDGNPDIAVAHESYPSAVSVLLGDGTGSFSAPTSFPTEQSPFWLAVADFDENGIPDLAVAHVSGTVGIRLGNGDGSFGPANSLVTAGSPYSVVVADFNGDSHADVAAPGYAASGYVLRVFLGDGDGGFASAPSVPTGGSMQYIATGDVNGDGRPDLVGTGGLNCCSTEGSEGLSVFFGDGAGNFGPPVNTALQGIGAPALGDLNGDGKLDAVVPYYEYVRVLLGDGAGHFTVTQPFTAQGLHVFAKVADFNGDGKPDVGMLDSYYSTAGVAFGDGTGNLTPPTTWRTHDGPFSPASWGMAIADLNHDAKLDFAISMRGQPNDVSVLLNRTGVFYPRPRGASPFFVSLVPAFAQCTSPNRTHGAPLAFGSCAAPVATSDGVAVGTPDANGAAANAVGSVRLDVGATPSDVGIKASITDVRCLNSSSCGATNQVAGPDYTGELQVSSMRRLTDRRNYASGLDQEQGTVADAPFVFTAPCTSTSDRKVGSSCSVNTTASALAPGSVQAGARALWQLDRVEVYDGGYDGSAATGAGNTLFMTQGLFVP